MQTFFDRIDILKRNQLKKQGDIARLLNMPQSSVSRHIKEKSEPDFIPKLRKFAIESNISPKELYFLITGNSFDHEEIPQNEGQLTAKYIAQTKRHIDSQAKQIEDLKHHVDFLEKALMEALKNRNSESQQVDTQQHHTKELSGHQIAPDNAGKNRKHTSNALP